MKKILFFTVAAMAGITMLKAQETIKPSGNIITRDVSVKPFKAIKANGLYELILTQGSTEAVKVETDDNLQKYIEVSNTGDTLLIDEPAMRNHNFNMTSADGEREKKQHFKVYVTFKNINKLDIQTIGNVVADAPLTFDALEINDRSVGNIKLSLTAQKLMVTNKGVGTVTLSGNVANAIITNTGVGSFRGNALVVQTMNITNTGVGHADVNVVKSLIVKDSFLGKVKNSGPAKTLKMEGEEI